MRIIIIIFIFIYIIFTFDGLKHYIFGCSRKFKNGRKCKCFDCPNYSECLFSERKVDKNE